MPSLLEIILGVGVPVAVSTLIVLAGCAVGAIVSRPQAWAAPVAIAAGLFAGVWTIQGRLPQYQPFQSTGAVIWLGFAAAIAASVLGRLKLPVVCWIAFALTGAASAYLLERPHLSAYSTFGLALLFTGSVMILLGWQAIWCPLSREMPVTAPLLLTAVIIGISILLLMSASMLLARFAGSLAPAVGTVAVFALVTGRVPFSRGGVFVTCLLALGLLMSGVYYADLLWSHAILLLASPLPLLIVLVGPLSRIKNWKRVLLMIVLTLLPIVVALLWALPTFLKTIDESAESAGY